MIINKKIAGILYLLTASCLISCAQPHIQQSISTNADTLRGSINPARYWWNVLQYNLSVTPNFELKTITGSNEIVFGITKPGNKKIMQIDLQQPLIIDSIIFNKEKITDIVHSGNVFFLDFKNYKFSEKKEERIKIFYHGKPREAKNPPWDGGWIWRKDVRGRPWMTVACQGLGASVWYPCKDHQSDEPDNGATLQVRVPDSLIAVANGRLKSTINYKDNTSSYTWEVKAPINNYNLVPYIGKYVHWSDTLVGETGKKLSLDYWVLDYDKEKAEKQFNRDVKRMLVAFEYWFGPYPFYEDGYKLVESPHLGMEHQSAVAYGNRFMDGYLGRDLSGTGWGLKWDYIIVHESGHEWFANNITTNDIADMWVHEGFTMYSEVLFVDYYYGRKAADEYVQGLRKTIRNDKPLIGHYGVNEEGSGDMYNKGANLLHTIRQIVNNDTLFRETLKGLNSTFYHKTVDSKDIEQYIINKTGKNLELVFDQYLRTTKIPDFEYSINNQNQLNYRWANCIDGFNMPLKLKNDFWIYPTTQWQKIALPTTVTGEPDKNFYINLKKITL